MGQREVNSLDVDVGDGDRSLQTVFVEQEHTAWVVYDAEIRGHFLLR